MHCNNTYNIIIAHVRFNVDEDEEASLFNNRAYNMLGNYVLKDSIVGKIVCLISVNKCQKKLHCV